MLAEIDLVRLLQICAIVVPLGVVLMGFIWRWQEKQDAKIAKTCTRTTTLEARMATHKEELNKGSQKFEGIASQIGGLQQESTETKTIVGTMRTTQTKMDGKLDDLLARG